MMEKVADALGANLFFTRLSGHGQTTEALSGYPKEWFQDATEHWKSGSVLAKSDSCGNINRCDPGTLARIESPRENIHALLFLSPNLGLRTLNVLALGPRETPWLPWQQENSRVQNLK